jgi:hypothetical protein
MSAERRGSGQHPEAHHKCCYAQAATEKSIDPRLISTDSAERSRLGGEEGGEALVDAAKVEKKDESGHANQTKDHKTRNGRVARGGNEQRRHATERRPEWSGLVRSLLSLSAHYQ